MLWTYLIFVLNLYILKREKIFWQIAFLDTKLSSVLLTVRIGYVTFQTDIAHASQCCTVDAEAVSRIYVWDAGELRRDKLAVSAIKSRLADNLDYTDVLCAQIDGTFCRLLPDHPPSVMLSIFVPILISESVTLSLLREYRKNFNSLMEFALRILLTQRKTEIFYRYR